jgi:hypothetical protein
MASTELTEEQLRALYAWIDAIPLSRPKKNIARDFADGVLLAEVVHAYFPHLVELHNYSQANSIKQKMYNLETLNQRTFRKLGYVISRDVIEGVANCRPGTIESVLNGLQLKMAKYREKRTEPPSSSAPSPKSRLSGNSAGAGGGMAGGRDGQQHAFAHGNANKPTSTVDEEMLLEKEQLIREQQETIEILELKIAKLEQLVRLKDNKIQKLMQR